MDAKICSKCRIKKKVSEFYICKYHVDGFRSWCKVCFLKNQRSPSRHMYLKKRHYNDPRKSMFLQAKYRARKDGVLFLLNLSDLKIPGHCPILGIPLKVNDGIWRNNSPTIDRIIPKLGYITGNIAVISHRANQIKNDASLEELLAIVNYVKAAIPAA